MQKLKPQRAVESDSSRHSWVPSVTALIPSIMERTLLFNFPASLRDVRNWQHLGDVAILANVHFAPKPDLP
jgi:hypothetical protein